MKIEEGKLAKIKGKDEVVKVLVHYSNGTYGVVRDNLIQTMNENELERVK